MLENTEKVSSSALCRPLDRRQFFSQLNADWWEQAFYTELVRDLREYAIIGKLRPIAIVTSGPISEHSIESLKLELTKAVKFTGVKLPSGLLTWHALNHGLDSDALAIIIRNLRAVGAELIPTGNVHLGLDKTSRMIDAREAVQSHIDSIDDNPIICWLDSDLEFSALVTDGDELQVRQPWPWIHMVWHQWLTQDEVDIMVGDVTGDSPIPSSSTIRTNLSDLAPIHEETNGARWSIRDPAYDLSEISRPDVRFPSIGSQWSAGFDMLQLLLWKGTLNRPLVASKEILLEPHRPWFVRGGVTVVFNRSAMNTPTPRFQSNGITVRRGDSFWLVRNLHLHGYKAGHFPFPLLHRRSQTRETEDELICSFRSRFFSDLFGAAALKGTVRSLSQDRNTLRVELHFAVHSRTKQSRQMLEEAIATLKIVNGSISASDSLVVERALVETIHKLDRIDLDGVIDDLSTKISHYFEAKTDE